MNKDMDRESVLVRIKADALRLLSFKPRSRDELRRRLQIKKYPSELVEEVIGLLTRQGLLNDEKFAKLMVDSLVHSRPTGRRQMAIELKKKGLSSELINKTLEEAGEYDEKKAARDLVFSRFSKMTGVSRETKKSRLYGFMRRRGFSNDVIFSVLTDLFKEFDGGEGAE
jgi:regulatory protein